MIPNKFKYLYDVKELPKIVAEGLKLVGIKEIPGKKHNPVILGWGERLGIADKVKDDEQAWCGLAMAIVLLNSGKELLLKGWDILRALQYKKFGVEIPIKDAALGDVLIFGRTGGGHVGVYVAETPTTFWVMGGNQANEYGFIEILKSRCVAVRRAKYINQPAGVRKFFLSSDGKVSQNEA